MSERLLEMYEDMKEKDARITELEARAVELEKQNERLQDRYIRMVVDLASTTTDVADLTITQQKTLRLLTSSLNSDDIYQIQEATRTSILILNGEKVVGNNT